MPFFKRKPGRTPLQLLSDQRRSLALAGLAVGAVAGAAFVRRRRGGEEPELDTAELAAEPEAPAASPESGPPAAVEVPPPAADPEAINAPRATEVAGRSRPPTEPATGELSAAEASILAVLAQSGRADEDRTAIAVATSLERDTAAVTDLLRKLAAEGVVAGELYTSSGDRIWAVTERGVRRLGAQS